MRRLPIDKKSNRSSIIIAILVLLLCPLKGYSQFDPVSIEAMINNHQEVHTVIAIRALSEVVALDRHNKQSKRETSYAKTQEQLDKISRAFNIVDLIINGGSTAFHTYNTGKEITKTLKDYTGLLLDYKNKVLSKFDVRPADLTIYETSQNMIHDVSEVSKELVKSYTDLSQYALLKRNCKPLDMLKILDSINDQYDRVTIIINAAYMKLWAYMSTRLGYWNDALLNRVNVKELCDAAHQRWYKAAVEAANNVRTRRSVKYKKLGGNILK